MVSRRMDMSVHSRKVSEAGKAGLSFGRVGRLSRWQPFVQACVDLTPQLRELLSQFWGVPVKVAFLGLSEQSHYFWRMDDFHVSQLQLEKNSEAPSGQPATALLRLSESLCASLLNRVLGGRSQSEAGFSFRQLSPLETTVLNEFSRDLLSAFKKNLLIKPAKKAKTELVQLLWVVSLDESAEVLADAMGSPQEAARFLEGLELGKIVLSVPAQALKPGSIATSTDASDLVPDAFFFHVTVPMRIYVGGSRVPLADLDHLERDDMIILENSQLDRMALIAPESGERLFFPVHISDSQAITLPYEQEFDEMDTSMDAQAPGASARQQLWDNLMIEVCAEFEPVKLPLRQLKQMSEGLVIEMDDLLHNQVSLSVEGKPLALGELIIVGDRFGVRVSQVLNPQGASETDRMDMHSSGKQASAPAAAVSGQSVAAHDISDSSVSDEEINLENFLNEDFDEALEGDEDW